MNIVKLVFVQTGGQVKQFIRPFTAFVNQNIQNSFNEAITGSLNNITPHISGIANDIIHPQSVHQGEVAIPNGWGEQKLRFYMEVESPEYAGGKKTVIVSGFTDIYDVSYNGMINPETRMYINNTLTVNDSNVMTPNGIITQRNVVNSQHVLHGNSRLAITGPSLVTLRPYDVFSQLGSGVLSENSAGFIDCNAMFDNNMQLASRKDEFSTTYLNNAYKAYNAANKNDSSYDIVEENKNRAFMNNYSSDQDVYINAKKYSTQFTKGHDDFIRILKMRTSMNHQDFFTYGELCDACGGNSVDNIAQVVRKGNEVKNLSMYNPFSTASWAGANYETVDASYLAHAIPSLMLDLMLSEIHVASTNDNIFGGVKTTVQACNGFSNKLDITPYMHGFIQRFEFEIMPVLTKQNTRKVGIFLHFNIIGESYIKLKYDNEHFHEFSIPTFCDGFFSPLISRSQMDLQNMSRTLDILLNNVTTQTTNSNMQYGQNQMPMANGFI